MANTGKKIITRLRQRYIGSGQYTGQVKPNQVGDQDYIAPVIDIETCPIIFDLQCPSIQRHIQTKKVWFEFSMTGSTQNNPGIARVSVILVVNGNTEVGMVQYTMPHTNFYTGSIEYLAASNTSAFLRVVFTGYDEVTLTSCDGQSFNIP